MKYENFDGPHWHEDPAITAECTCGHHYQDHHGGIGANYCDHQTCPCGRYFDSGYVNKCPRCDQYPLTAWKEGDIFDRPLEGKGDCPYVYNKPEVMVFAYCIWDKDHDGDHVAVGIDPHGLPRVVAAWHDDDPFNLHSPL